MHFHPVARGLSPEGPLNGWIEPTEADLGRIKYIYMSGFQRDEHI